MVSRKIGFPGTLGLIGAALFSVNAAASLEFTDPEMLSASGNANKTKLVRMGNGWLVSVFGDSTAGSEIVYDLKADGTRLSRDNFVRTCHPGNNESQCSLASDWSDPINISNAAHLSSIATGWNEEVGVEWPRPFYGDAEKPNIFVAGNFAVVTWVSKYCPGGKQRLISYNERDGVSVPFSCVYASYTNNIAGLTDEFGVYTPAAWNTVQLTDGSRDAKSDFNKGLKYDTKGLWSISWQEDPHGLQIGGADGPGDGASGASVTHGTDVWYTFTENLMGMPFAQPVRISDNYTNDGAGGNTSPVYHPDDLENEIEILERGTTGAARPNLILTGVVGTTPTAVIAYEESKGSDRLDSGKYVRYHEFPFNQPPESYGIYENGEPGCIISDPAENSRRVRFVAQHNPSPKGLRLGVFWKQGLPTQGGPSDIMVRFANKTDAEGSTGLRPEDMVPAVDLGCRVTPYEDAQLIANAPASNISSNTVPWTPVGGENLEPRNNLSDTTPLNPYEDARAHRAAIVGDDFYIGYSYAKDWAVATFVDMDNYNFWLRHYNAALGTWTTARNLSNISVDKKKHVKEPRLVKTPGIGMGCNAESIEASTYPENCPNKAALIVAWGTESNVYSHIGGAVEGDIYYTRTMDKAVTFEDPVVVSGIEGADSRFESQLRPSPAGNIVWTLWNEANGGGKHSMLSVSDDSDSSYTIPSPPPGGTTPPPPPPEDSFNLLVESLVMDTVDPVLDDDGNYYVPAKERGLTATVTIKNIGGLTVHSGEVVVETVQGGGFSYAFSFDELGTEETVTFDFTWDTRNKKSYTWRATVTPTDGDRDLEDNTLEVETFIAR